MVDIFESNRVSFEQFSHDPQYFIKNPELMIRIQDGLYLPEHGIPQIISLLAFNQDLNVHEYDEHPSEHEDHNEETLSRNLSPPKNKNIGENSSSSQKSSQK